MRNETQSFEDAAHTLDYPDAVAAAEGPPVAPLFYELLDVIGRGGMGVVYRAHDQMLDREVAVKILADRYAPGSQTAARFLEEACITGQLQHPGIPAVYQVGTLPGGRPFLAMKLIKGDTLDALLKANAPMDALAVFGAVSQAVGYAHAHGVIHRDLKPANIMVGAFGEVQVVDWGLAKVLTAGRARVRPVSDWEIEMLEPTADPEATPGAAPHAADTPHTRHGSILGTPAYMPPEQAAGELDKVDARSDVFGLGGLLCVLLTGEPPFTGHTAQSVRRNALRGATDEAFARLGACAADPAVVALCKRCLAFDPADRPATADEVAAEVAVLRQVADNVVRHAERATHADFVLAVERRRSRRRGFAEGLVFLTLGVALVAESVAELVDRNASPFALAATVVAFAVAGAIFGHALVAESADGS